MLQIDLLWIYSMGAGCFFVLFMPFIGVQFYTSNFDDVHYLPIINCLCYLFSIPCVFVQWKFDDYFDEKFSSAQAFGFRLRSCFGMLLFLSILILVVPGAFHSEETPSLVWFALWVVAVSITCTFSSGTLFQYCSFGDFKSGEGITALTLGFCSASAIIIFLAELFGFELQPTNDQAWGYYVTIICIEVYVFLASLAATRTEFFKETMVNKDNFIKKGKEMAEKFGPPQYWLGLTQSAQTLGGKKTATVNEHTALLVYRPGDSKAQHEQLLTLAVHLFVNTFLTLGMLSFYKHFPTTNAATPQYLVYSHWVADLCSRFFSGIYQIKIKHLHYLSSLRAIAALSLLLVAFGAFPCPSDYILIVMMSVYNFFGGAAINWIYILLSDVFDDLQLLQKGSQYLTLFYYSGVTAGTVLALTLTYVL